MSDLERFVRRGQSAQRAVDALTNAVGWPIRLDRDGGGHRHFVGDVPIHCGDPIRAYVDGDWRDGRYEGTLGETPAAFFYYVDGFGEERAKRLDNTIPVALGSGSRYTP